MDNVPLPKTGRLWKSKADLFRPFRTAAANAAADKEHRTHPASASPISLLYDPSNLPEGGVKDADEEEPNLRELNSALRALVDIFPDVQPEVFREMLISISEESRLQVVTEHLLTKKAKWVQSRYRTTGKTTPSKPGKSSLEPTRGARSDPPLADEDLFRSEDYKKAVKQVFYQEFNSLSKSTIRGVLAEQNFSYTLSRPVLQQVAARSWRFSFGQFWSRRSGHDPTDIRSHPFIMWQNDQEPFVRRTGSLELDHELYELFALPFITQKRQDRARADFEIATALNDTEAEEAEALFDCECCYSSVSFERVAVCDDACHLLCLDCIQRTVNEALYGQGWSRAANLDHATVRCFASEDCSGNIPQDLVRRALTQGVDNTDIWDDFQARVTNEALLQSRLPFQRCPFCDYAEVQEYPRPRLRHPLAIWSHIASRAPPAIQIMFLSFFTFLTLFTIPCSILGMTVYILISLIPPLNRIFRQSVTRLQKHRRPPKFTCRHPDCRRTSCIKCTARWTDPHSCFESEKTSLRTAIETASSQAIKRTCPKCLLSFVKASGCNKMVCNCGYTMCYVCRSEITSKEGYGHFCQHFRVNGGRCGECERCDLYGDEDEQAVIRRAGEEAERLWREREEGHAGKGGLEGDKRQTALMIDALVGDGKREWWEECLDGVLDVLVA